MFILGILGEIPGAELDQGEGAERKPLGALFRACALLFLCLDGDTQRGILELPFPRCSKDQRDSFCPSRSFAVIGEAPGEASLQSSQRCLWLCCLISHQQMFCQHRGCENQEAFAWEVFWWLSRMQRRWER